MFPLITIVQTPENSLQSILGCFPAYQANRSRPIWTIPGVNPRSAYAKTRHNALQGKNSTPYHIDTLPDALKRLTSQFRPIPRDLNRSTPPAFVHSRVFRPTKRPQNKYEFSFISIFFHMNGFSYENIFKSESSGYLHTRAGGRARAHV